MSESMDDTPKEYEVLDEKNSIKIVKYSEKSVAAIGKTKKYKDILKGIGCKWNSKLKCGPGWILSAKKLDELKQVISSSLQIPVVVTSKPVKLIRKKHIQKEDVESIPESIPENVISVSDMNRIETKIDSIINILTKMESVKSQPVKSQPVKSQPVKSQPVKSQPVKKIRVKKEKTTPVKTEVYEDVKPIKKLLRKH